MESTGIRSFTRLRKLCLSVSQFPRNHACSTAFRRLRIHAEWSISFIMSVCWSLCPHVSARLPLDGFPWNFILATFMKICRETPNLVKTGKNIRQFKWKLTLYIFSIKDREPLGVYASTSLRFRDHTYLDTPHSVGRLWTSDRPVAETSAWQHTTLTRDRYPGPRRDSNPQSQEASGRRPTP